MMELSKEELQEMRETAERDRHEDPEPTPQIDKGLQYIRDRYGGTVAARYMSIPGRIA